MTLSSYSCGPRGEGPDAVQSAVPRQKIEQLLGGWVLSVDATQTDDGSEDGMVSALPSRALGAVQLRAGFCNRCSVGQPSKRRSRETYASVTEEGRPTFWLGAALQRVSLAIELYTRTKLLSGPDFMRSSRLSTAPKASYVKSLVDVDSPQDLRE
ncbi:hypothetical protein MRX96_037046 [Rhipicephalus microplus]